MIFPPHFKLLLSNERFDFCDFFKLKIKRINNTDLFSQPSLIIFTKGADIFGNKLVYILVQLRISKKNHQQWNCRNSELL